MHLAVSTLCTGTSHVVPPRRAAPPKAGGERKLGVQTHLKRILNDNDAYYKLEIIARLSKLTNVPDTKMLSSLAARSPFSRPANTSLRSFSRD